MNILADASLPGIEQAFPKPFILQTYRNLEELKQLLPTQDGLICRSTLKVDELLLQGSKIRYVATASSGTDHIDATYLQQHGITLIDAKGCNAISVGDYVMSSIAYLNQLNLIKGKKAGVIGLGHVGTEVTQRLQSIGFDLVLYDPPKALLDHSFISSPFDALYDCDLLCIHADLNKNPIHPTFNLFNDYVLTRLKPETVIINAARGGIVNEEALLHAENPFTYCTDVYQNEPDINPAIVQKAVIATPHIAGHSIEGKYRAVEIVSIKLHQIAQVDLPNYAKPAPADKAKYHPEASWEEQILALYNPIKETQKFKQEKALREGFLNIRKAHQFRHDFNAYL